MLDASEEDAYLIFGVADSDDVGVSLWCPLRRGIVNLYLPRPVQSLEKAAGQKEAGLTVTAGGETVSFRGKVDVNREADSASIEAEIPVDHPVLAAMAKADRFTVTAGGEEIVFPLFEADLAGLLEFCRKT